ncbi:MAG: PTS sugar transporter subunit IIA [Acidobacteriota bacterium]
MTPATTSSVGVVVISHGQFATELLNAAEMIVGDLPGFTAVSIGWHDDVTVARDAIEQAIAKVDKGRGVLLLTDMFGGTPSNLGLSFLKDGRVEVLTGANLPMLIKLAKTPASADLVALAREICEHGRVAIRVASDLLRGDA